MSKLSTFVYGHVRPMVILLAGFVSLLEVGSLNILLRSLTGAVDIPGDDQLGDKKRRLVPVDRLWFRRRVPDDAVDAKVTVCFYLGVSYFEVNGDALAVAFRRQA